jgi:beta-glucosidase
VHALQAAELARADVVIAAVGVASSEGTDRSSLSLGKDEDEVVEWAAARHANVVVCVVAPGAVLMPWADHANVSGVMLQFMPGQEAGHGLADVLFGKREPTARLPVSIPYEQAQVNFTKEQYPGVNLHAHYLERSEVGYRWFLAKNVKPRFPFGFGLQFAAVAWLGVFAGPKPAVLFVALRNTGTTEALELVQVYAALPPQAGEAAPRLVHFERFRVAPQRVRVVRLDLALGPLRSWKDGAWTLLPGRYTFSAGTSSQDIKGKVEAVL